MAIAREALSADRCNFQGSVSLDEINDVINDRRIQVFQTSSPSDDATWKRLDEKLFAKRPDIELRVYGFYSQECDLAFLRNMTHVRKFSADCLRSVVNAEAVCDLRELRSLSIGVYDLESFDFLKGLATEKVFKLALMATRSKKPDLGILAAFPHLTTLFIEGQERRIETIAGLPDLCDLTLRSVSPDNLDFIKPLQHLTSLDIKLGGITNLQALRGLNTIKYLELWQVKGLSDIGVVGTMLGLQSLFLQSLKNVVSIPDLSRLTRLRRVFLENMKGLKDFAPIASAPALEEFVHAMATGSSPEDYAALLGAGTLKKAAVRFGSKKKDDAFRALARRHGIGDYTHTPFVFR